MTTAPVWQTRLFAGAVVLFCGVEALCDADLETQAIVLAPAVALLGLPHGALDLPVARARGLAQGKLGSLLFLLSYFIVTLSVVAIWLALPEASLAAFLIYSAIHFSRDWDYATAAWRLVGGVSAVAAPALTHPAAVREIFAHLTFAPSTGTVEALAWSGATALIAFLALLFGSRRSAQATYEVIGIWGAAALLPPLLYFVVYFCFLHSPRHLTEALREVEWNPRVVMTVAMLSITAGIAGAGVYYSLPVFEVPPSIVRVVFIGLAGLTVPHMALLAMTSPRRAVEP